MTDTSATEPTTPTQSLAIRRAGALGGYRPPPEKPEFEAIISFANYLAKVPGFLPKHFFGEPYKVMAAILYGRDLGLSNFMSLQHLVPIEGKVGADAQLVGMLVRRAGHKLEDKTTNQGSTVTITRADDGSVHEATFTIEDARQAALLGKDNWKHYPAAMLYSRALTACARKGAQDALMGVSYTPEELGVETADDGGYTGGGYAPIGKVIDVLPEAVREHGDASVPSPVVLSVEVPKAPGDAPVVVVEATAVPDAPPPQAAPFNAGPLSGPSVSRRMGRSVGPAPKRTNVVTVEPGPQGAEKPATAPEVPEQAPVSAVVAPPQPAPSALTDEPIEAAPLPAPVPVDDGHEVYLGQQRELLRQGAAVLARLNAITRNHLVHSLKGEDPEEVPPATPSKASDESLQNLIERDYPGRTLATLGEAEIQTRLELIEPLISKRRDVLKGKGITEE